MTVDATPADRSAVYQAVTAVERTLKLADKGFRPTEPGYCANCGRTPCGWAVERTGLCIASTCPKTEWDMVGEIIFQAREELSGMSIDDILAMCARVHEARRQAYARYQP